MDSEWDVLYALHRTIKTFPATISVEWVASHQDDDPNVNISDLPLGAQLNIEADKLATTGLHESKMKPIVPLDPSSEVMFHFRDRTITRDFKRTMSHNISLPVLMSYYMNRFGWTDKIFNRIDWDNFGPAFRKLANKTLRGRSDLPPI